MDEPSLPRRLSSHYRLKSCLAGKESGGVWLLQGADGNRYVLKTIPTDKQMPAREYALMEQMPEDYFEQDGMAYLVRTYLPGRPLAEVWRQDTPLPCRAMRAHRYPAVRAAGTASRYGSPPVIRRDIKPENIIFSPEGDPALIDFGIARNYRDGQGADTVFMGAPAI